MKCPCCGKPYSDIHGAINFLIRGPVARRLAHVMADNRGRWLSVNDLITLVYGDRWDGGPRAADQVIDVTFIEIRDALAPYGVELEGRVGGVGGRRMKEETPEYEVDSGINTNPRGQTS